MKFLSALAVAGLVSFAEATVWHVNQLTSAGLGQQDGATWNTAFQDLQDALATANSGDEIWIAAGVYYPDESGGGDSNDKGASFTLKTDVLLYGGFSGSEESLTERDTSLNVSILSGDYLQTDPNPDGNHIAETYAGLGADNSDHVVTANGISGALLDGVVITAGDATSGSGEMHFGGGLYVVAAQLSLVNCRLLGNDARYGGSVSINGSDVSIDQCEISGANAWTEGGGVWVGADSTLQAKNSIIHDNRSWKGAGIAATGGSNAVIHNVQFYSNTAINHGAAFAKNGSEIELANCLLYNNHSEGNGGAIYSEGGELLKLNHCSVVRNSSVHGGGALHDTSSAGTVILSTVFWGNSTDGLTNTAEASVVEAGATASFDYSLIQNINLTAQGAGNLDGTDPANDPLFADIVSFDLRLQSLSPLIDAGHRVARAQDDLDLDDDGMTQELIPFDAFGNDRVEDGFMDIGAAEFSAAPLNVATNGEERNWDYPLGPIGGRFYIHSGKNYIRVSEVTAGAPGDQAGLQVNDFIFGAFGKRFSPSTNHTWEFTGVVKELGGAIEKAERSSGQLPLMVLRPGVGEITVTVTLTVNGGLGAAYPLGSSVFAAEYEHACQRLHDLVFEGRYGANLGYNTGWAGMALLAHPNWNDTSGAKPFRNAINALRDDAADTIDREQFAPVERYLYDGSQNPNWIPWEDHAGRKLGNWQLATSAMFLAAYAQKTGETSFSANGNTYDLQYIAELLANRVQWWLQPINNYFPGGGGAHGGVNEDYGGNGFNVIAAHLLSAIAMVSNVTDSGGLPVVDLSVRNRDGRHFGYPDEVSKPEAAKIAYDNDGDPLSILPPGWDPNVEPSIEDKIDFIWEQFKKLRPEGIGAVPYGIAPLLGYDSGARTAAAFFGYSQYMEGVTPAMEDQAELDLMREYIVGHNSYYLHAHGHTASALYFSALAMPYMPSRERRFFLDSWRFYYTLSREPDGSVGYFPGRNRSDGDRSGEMDVLAEAFLYAVASGNLELFPGLEGDQLIVDFGDLDHSWKELSHRDVVVTSGALDFPLSVVDSDGVAQNPSTYSAQWTASGWNSAEVSFDNPNSITTNASFSEEGTYDLVLTVTANGDAGNVVEEKIRVHVKGGDPGIAKYEIFTNIEGSAISDLTSSPKFQNNASDNTSLLRILERYERWQEFGARVTGYITPQETGSYRFYVAGDDSARWSMDLGPGMQLLCSADAATDPYEWDKFVTQESVEVSLTAGETYPFELLHKVREDHEGYVMVSWLKPGAGEIQLIDTGVLSCPELAAEDVAITKQPLDEIASMGDTVTFEVETTGPEPRLYQWRRNGIPFGVPTGSPILELPNVGGGYEGSYDCVYTSGGESITSDSVHLLLVDTGDLVAGGMWVETYTGLVEGTFDDLTGDSRYPYFSTASFVVPDFEFGPPPNARRGYGQRTSGWIVPIESGNYRFWFNAADYGELYLSPDEFREHRQVIATDDVNAGVARNNLWSQHSGVSEYFFLEAGKRYYVEVITAEPLGQDYFAVNWQKEGEPQPADNTFLPGEVLQYRVGGYYNDPSDTPAYQEPDPAIVLHPVDESITLGGTAHFTIGTVGASGATYQWRHQGRLIGTPSDRPLLILPNLTFGHQGQYDCVCDIEGVTLISSSATLTVTGGGNLVSGGLWMDYFDDVSSGTLSGFKSSPAFPYLPSSSEIVTESFHGPNSAGAYHGRRTQGWLVPVESGDFRFWFNAAEEGELYFSLDEFRNHRKLVASDDRDGNVGSPKPRNWIARSSAVSEYYHLEAGKRYYIEVIQVEPQGEDFFAFTLQRKDDPFPTVDTSLPPSLLQYRVGGYYDDPAGLPPFTGADAFTVKPGKSISFDLLANDADVSGLTITEIEDPQSGYISLAADGRTLTYVAAGSAGTTDSFNYTVVNGAGITATATVFVEIVAQDTTDGLLAHWKLDQIDNGLALDSSGNGHHASVINELTIVDDPEFGNVMQFPAGADGYLDVPVASLAGINTAVSFAFWAYGEQPNSTKLVSMLHASDATRRKELILFMHHHQIRALRWQAGESNPPSKFPDKLETPVSSSDWNGSWQHWVFSKDQNDGLMQVYRNGELWASETDRSQGFVNPFVKFTIGTSNNTNSDWAGKLREFRIYDRALAPAEIETLSSGAALAPTELWQQTYFNQAQLADPLVSDLSADASGDGYPNLLAYAFHQDPFQPRIGEYSTTDGQSLRYRRQQGGTQYGPHHYQIGNLHYYLEVSASMEGESWLNDPSLLQVVGSPVDGGNATELVTVSPAGVMLDSEQVFLRLRVVLE